MANTTRSTKTSTSTKKAGAKTAPAKNATGKNGKDNTSKTELLRIYVIRQHPTVPAVKDVMTAVPGVNKARGKAVQGSVLRMLRTAERLGKLKK